MVQKLMSHFANVQAHYDLSDDFFRLFLDSTQTYSCAYFEREDMTVEEPQIAKVDLTLDRLGLKPGMTLLDIGCGWGSVLKRAVERYDVNVVGLTLSKNQHAHCRQVLDQTDSNRSRRALLCDWAEFTEPVDRIVVIEALEHFGFHRYEDFFKFAYHALPDDGVMLLHSITGLHVRQAMERGIPLTMGMAKFIRFMVTDIFPGGRLPMIETIEDHTAKVGFKITRVQDEAIAIQSEEVYDRYMKYLTGCAKAFRMGYIDVNQFTLEK